MHSAVKFKESLSAIKKLYVSFSGKSCLDD